MAYWYPAGAAIVANADFIIEEATNKFFTSASDPRTLKKSTTMSAY
jgi:hypothetical protein